jgi:hypothetical protein
LLWIFGYHGASGYQEVFSQNFSFSFGTSAIMEPFHGVILSFWNLGYHGAFSQNFSFGTSAITKPFHGIILFFWNLGYHGAFSWTFSVIHLEFRL